MRLDELTPRGLSVNHDEASCHATQSVWPLRNLDVMAVSYMLPISHQVSNTLTGLLITDINCCFITLV